MKKRRICRMCGKPYYAHRANQKTCSSFCSTLRQMVKTREYKEKKRAEREKASRKKPVAVKALKALKVHYDGVHQCGFAREHTGYDKTKVIDDVTCKNCKVNMRKYAGRVLGSDDKYYDKWYKEQP